MIDLRANCPHGSACPEMNRADYLRAQIGPSASFVQRHFLGDAVVHGLDLFSSRSRRSPIVAYKTTISRALIFVPLVVTCQLLDLIPLDENDLLGVCVVI